MISRQRGWIGSTCGSSDTLTMTSKSPHKDQKLKDMKNVGLHIKISAKGAFLIEAHSTEEQLWIIETT